MKKLILLGLFFCCRLTLVAQTNNIQSSGNVGIGITTPLNIFQVNSLNSGSGVGSWIAGNFGGQTGSRVVMGLLYGTATIGAHTNALTGWANLAINPDGGNVGIGTSTPMAALDVRGMIQISSINQATPPADLSYGLFPFGGVGLGIYSAAGDPTQGIGIWTNPAGVKTEVMRILSGGNIGIGTVTPNEKLSVNGKIRAREIRVDVQNWPDYVFKPDYQRPSLDSIEVQIKATGHLHGIPSALEAKSSGIELGEMNRKLLQKVEELTLYLIDQHKKIIQQNATLDQQNIRIQKLEAATQHK